MTPRHIHEGSNFPNDSWLRMCADEEHAADPSPVWVVYSPCTPEIAAESALALARWQASKDADCVDNPEEA